MKASSKRPVSLHRLIALAYDGDWRLDDLYDPDEQAKLDEWTDGTTRFNLGPLLQELRDLRLDKKRRAAKAE